MLSFALVALVPVVFLAIQMHKLAWDDAWREIREKHRLLAVNLAAPISIYIQDHRGFLGLLGTALAKLDLEGGSLDLQNSLLGAASARLSDFESLSLVDLEGRLLFTTAEAGKRLVEEPMLLNQESCFVRTRDTGKWALSGIKASPFTGDPTLFMSYPVHGNGGELRAVLLGELDIDLIESLRRRIVFGKRGHSAIVDQFGKVIAHPNADWMARMHDLSHLSVVKEMMAGKTGATEFYSPFVKQDMVAGYAAVPDIGWGIMVPQPKSEVEDHVRHIIYTQLGWMVFGLMLAMGLALVLARWITDPLKRLASAAIELVNSDYQGSLPRVDGHVPREVSELNHAMAELVDGLRDSYTKIDELNRDLHAKVEQATMELRSANVRLEELVSLDYLTSLPNRRHFESRLTKSLQQRRHDDQDLCLILIDVDHFKQVNDTYGHAAGDAVLTQLAAILKKATRGGDLVARYAGDEFVVWMKCDRAVGQLRAQEILDEVTRSNFAWEEHRIELTLSMGLVCLPVGRVSDSGTLLRQVDKAMYRAKKGGRNRLEILDW